jgi:hypothetical protein
MRTVLLPRRIALLILVLIALPSQGFAMEVGQGAALLKAIKAQKLDDTIEILNEVKRTQHRGDVLPLVQDLWNNDKKRYADLPWSFVNLDVVRISIADILVQAYRNGLANVDRKGLHAFVRKVAGGSGDVQARGNALLVLGTIDDARDVPVLKSAALEERDWISTSAIISLGTMCNGDAGKALDALPRALKGREFLERAKDAQQMHREMTKSKAGWCRQRPFT